MRRPRVYLETTIFNHYFDTDRDAHAATVKLFGEIKAGKYEAYTSAYVVDELVKASEPKRSKMLALIDAFDTKVLNYSDDVGSLADAYVGMGMMPEKYHSDALHIACATVNDLDYVFSLNFKHINKLKTKAMSNFINHKLGYRQITILSPQEVEVFDDE